jgi:hypothetical protein
VESTSLPLQHVSELGVPSLQEIFDAIVNLGERLDFHIGRDVVVGTGLQHSSSVGTAADHGAFNL